MPQTPGVRAQQSTAEGLIFTSLVVTHRPICCFTSRTTPRPPCYVLREPEWRPLALGGFSNTRPRYTTCFLTPSPSQSVRESLELKSPTTRVSIHDCPLGIHLGSIAILNQPSTSSRPSALPTMSDVYIANTADRLLYTLVKDAPFPAIRPNTVYPPPSLVRHRSWHPNTQNRVTTATTTTIATNLHTKHSPPPPHLAQFRTCARVHMGKRKKSRFDDARYPDPKRPPPFLVHRGEFLEAPSSTRNTCKVGRELA